MNINKVNQILPRMIYISDVPVESTVAGAALIYRLLQNYPNEKLKIVESDISQSTCQQNRLPDVSYQKLYVGNKRWLNSRFNSLYTAYLLLTAKQRASQLTQLVKKFKPEAILTVAHGFSWLTAAALAEQFNLPLHLIVHDNWIQTINLPQQLQKWADEQFADVYRRGKSRFCISPYMVEEYEKRYGVNGTVLYPSCAADIPEFDKPIKHQKEIDVPLVFGYAGSINHLGYAKALVSLASVLQTFDGKLIIYSTVTEEFVKKTGLNKSNIVFHSFIPSQQLVYKLRDEVDILFLPMVFEDIEPEPTSNVKVCFPSKLTDYTATGLPLLIWGPPYCSAVRWAKANPGVAEVIEQKDIQSLEKAITNLYTNQEYRFCLAAKALSIGKDYFSYERVIGKFYQTISHNE